MPRNLLISLLLLWLLAAPALAQAPCTRAEFLTIFKQTADLQLQLDASLGTVEDLLSFSENEIAARQNRSASLLNCADALEYQLMTIEVTGDFIARQALDLANVPQGDNPYRLRFAGAQERLEASLSAMLGRDRNDAPAADERSLPDCSADEISELDELVAELLTLLDNSEASDDLVYALLAIDARLLWREEALQGRPACAEWVELLPTLSAAATDSAADYAIGAIVAGADNPFAGPAAMHIVRLQHWLSPGGAAHSVPSGATIASSGLPACSPDELGQAYDNLKSHYASLLATAGQISDISDLQHYSEAYLQFRAEQLAELPLCAEAFSVGWEARQLLGGLAIWAALDLINPASEQNPRLEDDSARVADLIDGLAIRLAGINGLSTRAPEASLLACSRLEILFLSNYLLPEFDEFSQAALSLQTPEGLPELVESSYKLRQLLWLELPRCAEALEAGLVMRRIAADLVALIGLEAAGIPAVDVPYLHGVAADMSWLAARLSELTGDLGSTDRAGARYFVIAERGANIRSCASTDCRVVATALAGDTVYAADDSDAWYRLNLPDNQTGYIAGFLLSKTPPEG